MQRFAEKTQIDRPGLVFGFRTGATAWVAFAIASLLHVQNAYWAAMAAWIVMQPTRGMLLERGFYRVIGSIVGAVAGFAIIHWVHQPYVAVVVLALWMGACAGLAHLFRRVRSYGATLGGITALVVVMPTLHASEQSLDLALARVICTLVGVAVATVSGLLFVPVSPQRAFIARLRGLAAEAVGFAGNLLASGKAKPLQRKAQALLEEMAALEQALVINTAGMWNSQHRIHHFSAFIGATLEVMAAARAVDDGRADAASGVSQAVSEALVRLEASLRDEPGVAPRMEDLDGIFVELTRFDARLGASLRDLFAAEADILVEQSDLGARRFRKAHVSPDNDLEVAGMSAAVACVAVSLAGSAALASSWSFAPLAALGVGNFVMVLSGMDRPHLMAPKIFLGVFSGVIAATIFRIFVLPHAHTTGDILLMVIPFMVLGALLRASRIATLPAVDYNMCFMLAGQPFLPAQTSLSLILQSGAALILGIGLVASGHVLLPRDPGKRVRNIARLIVRDLERMADLAIETESEERWRALMAHRLIRLTTHLSRMENLQANKPEVVLAALNLGYAVRDLRDLLLRHDLTPAERALIGEVIATMRRLSAAPQERLAILRRARDEGRAAASTPPVATALARTAAALEKMTPLLEAAPIAA